MVKQVLLALFASLSLAVAARGDDLSFAKVDPHAQLATTLNVSSLQPGKQAILAVVVDVEPKHHAQSHTPLEDFLIAFEVKLTANPSLTFGTPSYPPAEIKTYPAIGKVSVYDGRVIVYVPIDVKADAKPGDIELTGTASFQICDDNTCFGPTSAKLSVKTQVVDASVAVAPIQPDIFKDFASRAPVATSQPSTRATLSSASAPPVVVDDTTPKWGLPLALGIAFVAGILFNIVPCVLPMLPLKVLGIAEVAQHSRSRAVFLSSIFGLGIVTVFAVLAVLVLGLKKISWGQQYSNPYFLWGMVAVLLVMALWMFDVVHVNLPSGAYSFAPRHDTITGNYIWGVLTAIFSTPCTGPMFAAVMAWAAPRPAYEGIPAMMFVGVGMAFPYVVLSAFPEAARKFPRVGPWSALFKQELGFIMLAVAVFFAAGRFVHPSGQWWAVVPIAALAGLYLMARTVQLSKESRPVAISSILSMTMVTASVLIACRFSGVFDEEAPGGKTGTASTVTWTPYSDDALAAARGAGKIVLVKFTANWCLNCQYVEATVYHDNRALASLRDHDVVMLKADLTTNDAAGWPRLREITPAGGIPLTAIYAPGYDKPIQISSVYTTDTLVKTLDQLTAPKTADAK